MIKNCISVLQGGAVMIYLDNSATTQPYKEVIDAFVKVSSTFFGNPSSLHGVGEKAEKLLQQARRQIAQLLKVKEKELLFTSGGTEGNNMAIKGIAKQYQLRGNHLITTTIEHPSVIETMKQLEKDGFEVTYLPVDGDGRISLDDLQVAIKEETILVSVMHVNNEIGTIQPIKAIGTLLKEYPKVFFHVDAVQSVGKVPLELYEFGIDACTMSSHKFHGLKGSGILYLRQGVSLTPLLAGGNQESELRSGTENTGGIVAMAKALRMTNDYFNSSSKLSHLMNEIRIALSEIEDVIIHTPIKETAPHILNFSVKGFKSEVFVHALEENDIYISTTSACSSKHAQASSTLLAMGIKEEIALSAVRVSLSYHTTADEVEKFIHEVKNTIFQLRKVMKA